MAERLFAPRDAATVNIDVSSSSQNIQVSDTPGDTQIAVHNDGTATVWIEFGDSNSVSAATTTGIPVGAGHVRGFTANVGSQSIWVAAIAAGATGKIYFTPGTGM